MESRTQPAFRERTRRAIQGELVEVAQSLFVADGYDATTVDAIAAAASMSKRTFFRYFASKEEVVLGKYDLMGERLLDALRARPANEPLWESLRRMFDEVIAYTSTAEHTPAVQAMERIVTSTPSLRAAYLGRMDVVEERITAVIRERGSGRAESDSAARDRALVGAAFACFHAARATTLGTEQSFADQMDRLMNAIGTAGAT